MYLFYSSKKGNNVDIHNNTKLMSVKTALYYSRWHAFHK